MPLLRSTRSRSGARSELTRNRRRAAVAKSVQNLSICAADKTVISFPLQTKPLESRMTAPAESTICEGRLVTAAIRLMHRFGRGLQHWHRRYVPRVELACEVRGGKPRTLGRDQAGGRRCRSWSPKTGFLTSASSARISSATTTGRSTVAASRLWRPSSFSEGDTGLVLRRSGAGVA